MNSKKRKLLIICGPTASGKSELAIKCARLLKSEIVYADALDVYRGLDVGTAKPTEFEKYEIPHHLIDVVDKASMFSVGDYKELALPIIEDILSRGKTPVICGGSGFYINSILYDLSYGNSCANIEARKKYMALAEKYGKEYVYDVLVKVDPVSAVKLHPNDLKRVVRALEIYESGYKKSDLTDVFTPVYDYSAYALNYDRDELYARIDKMIENGLVDEVKNLIAEGVTINNQCMQGIGYKEIYTFLIGNCNLADAISQIKLNTKHYAKRQITFFKRLKGLIWVNPENFDKLAERIVDNL